LHIERFCRAYAWADKILVADGGSTDNTKKMAGSFSNVKVLDYPVRITMKNDLWRNPHAPHINFLIDHASLNEKADWIIFDDCDSIPSKALRNRELFETSSNFIFVTRLYLWREKKYFPKLSQNNGGWSCALWAWRRTTNLRYREDKLYKQEFVSAPKLSRGLELSPPNHFLSHYFCLTEADTEKKLKFYVDSGQHPKMTSPLKFGGVLHDLPEWALND